MFAAPATKRLRYGQGVASGQVPGPVPLTWLVGTPFSCGGGLQLGDRDLLDLPERQLQEALTEGAEPLRVARRQEAVHALAARLVRDRLPLERLGHLARGFLGGEDKVHAA